MSAWTHRVCELCYADLFPGRPPVRMATPDAVPCCACGAPLDVGPAIFVRRDPRELLCRGRTGEHA